MVRLANGGAPNWLDTWWLLVGGISFVLLGAERRRRTPAPSAASLAVGCGEAESGSGGLVCESGQGG
jgi:hypothetical protein